MLTITPWDLTNYNKQRTTDYYRWDSTNGNQTLVGTTRLRRGNTLYNIGLTFTEIDPPNLLGIILFTYKISQT